MNWFEQADAVAFVGTSFSVHITSLAMQQARAREVPVFNFNLAGSLKGGRRFSVYNILGRAEDTLGQVVQLVTQKMATDTKPPASAEVEVSDLRQTHLGFIPVSISVVHEAHRAVVPLPCGPD